MSPDNIMNTVCQSLFVSVDDIKSTVRKKNVMQARKLSVYYLNKMIGDPQIISTYFSCSVKTIYRYISNFDDELRGDKTLRYIKSLCDKTLNTNSN